MSANCAPQSFVLQAQACANGCATNCVAKRRKQPRSPPAGSASPKTPARQRRCSPPTTFLSRSSRHSENRNGGHTSRRRHSQSRSQNASRRHAGRNGLSATVNGFSAGANGHDPPGPPDQRRSGLHARRRESLTCRWKPSLIRLCTLRQPRRKPPATRPTCRSRVRCVA